MALLKFEGDISGLSEKQTQFIRNALEKLGFESNKVVFESVAKAKGNHSSSILKITVEVNDGADLKIIAKYASENETSPVAMNSGFMFSNEVAMYEQVLSKFGRIQNAADLFDEERFKQPKCYGCLTEERNEVLLLEDLEVSGYVISDKGSLRNDEVELIIKNIARLHSISFAMKKNEPGIYEILKSKLVDIRNNDTEQFIEFLNQLENSASEVLNEDKFLKHISGLVNQRSTQKSKIKKYETTSKHLVILQGDAVIDNVMFKFVDDKPLDCIIIDYQMSKEGNPAEDLLQMIFNSTDHGTRMQHYNKWIDYYHDQLDKSLSDFGMKASFVYTKDKLEADLKRYSKIYFIVSLVRHYRLVSKLAEGNEDVGVQLSDKDANIFKANIEDLVESYRELGYLA